MITAKEKTPGSADPKTNPPRLQYWWHPNIESTYCRKHEEQYGNSLKAFGEGWSEGHAGDDDTVRN